MSDGFLIQEIKQFAKGKYEVSLEGGEPLVLYGKELNQFSIKEGTCLSTDDYHYILKEILSKRATKRAMHLLMKMDYTETGLREKLQKNHYPQCAIDAAVEYLYRFHYLDDRRYTENYIRSYQEKYSKRILMQRLLHKGINRDLIEEILAEVYESDERDMIIKLLKKRHYNPAESDMKEKQKTYAFLMRKGFSSSEISSVMKLDDPSLFS